MQEEHLKSEQKYRHVVESLREVIFQTDWEGTWLYLNPAWTEITGFSLGKSIGTNILNYVHPDDQQWHFEMFLPLMKKKDAHCQHEARFLTMDGGFRWFDVYARPVLDDRGNIIAMLSGFLVVSILSDLLNNIARIFGKVAYVTPSWLPKMEFPWWICFGTIVTFLVAILFRTSDAQLVVNRHGAAASTR